MTKTKKKQLVQIDINQQVLVKIEKYILKMTTSTFLRICKRNFHHCVNSNIDIIKRKTPCPFMIGQRSSEVPIQLVMKSL